MIKLASFVASCGILMATTGTALAGGLVVTPVIPSFINGGANLVCQALNAGTARADITIEIVHSADGLPLTTAGPVTVDPGTHKTAADDSVFYNTYCRVSGLSPKRARVTYSIMDANNNVLMSVTAP